MTQVTIKVQINRRKHLLSVGVFIFLSLAHLLLDCTEFATNNFVAIQRLDSIQQGIVRIILILGNLFDLRNLNARLWNILLSLDDLGNLFLLGFRARFHQVATFRYFDELHRTFGHISHLGILGFLFLSLDDLGNLFLLGLRLRFHQVATFLILTIQGLRFLYDLVSFCFYLLSPILPHLDSYL